EPQSGHAPSVAAPKPSGAFAGAPSAARDFRARGRRGPGLSRFPDFGEAGSLPSSAGAARRPFAPRDERPVRPDFATGRLGPPSGTGISVSTPESVSWRITGLAPSIERG